MTFDFPGERLDLDKVAASGQCFRWTPAPKVPGAYIVPAAGLCATIHRLDGLVRVHEHTISNANPTSPESLSARAWWRHYLDEGSENCERWAVLDYFAARDPDAYLSRATRSADGMRLLRQEPFETLVSFIISQNNNIPRIKRTIEALCRRFGKHHYTPDRRGNFPGAEWWDFPEPEALTDEGALQGLGLGYRDAYVANAARAVSTGRLDLENLPLVLYAEARARLKMLPGVGDKVADCVCLYGLGHIEAFPIDVHIRRVLEREYSGAFPFSQFGSYAGFVQQLIFYYEREHTARKEIAIP